MSERDQRFHGRAEVMNCDLIVQWLFYMDRVVPLLGTTSLEVPYSN